jgi:hypothetical protein
MQRKNMNLLETKFRQNSRYKVILFQKIKSIVLQMLVNQTQAKRVFGRERGNIFRLRFG